MQVNVKMLMSLGSCAGALCHSWRRENTAFMSHRSACCRWCNQMCRLPSHATC